MGRPPKEPTEPLANRIREHRTRCGLTLQELANRIGVTDEALRQWETSGKNQMTLASLSKVATALGVAVSDLLIESAA